MGQAKVRSPAPPGVTWVAGSNTGPWPLPAWQLVQAGFGSWILDPSPWPAPSRLSCQARAGSHRPLPVLTACRTLAFRADPPGRLWRSGRAGGCTVTYHVSRLAPSPTSPPSPRLWAWGRSIALFLPGDPSAAGHFAPPPREAVSEPPHTHQLRGCPLRAPSFSNLSP